MRGCRLRFPATGDIFSERSRLVHSNAPFKRPIFATNGFCCVGVFHGPRANLRVAPLPRATSSLVPNFDVTVRIVLDDYGKAGRVYRESDEEDTTVRSVVDDLLTGQFNNPVRVVAFNTSSPRAGRRRIFELPSPVSDALAPIRRCQV